MPRHPFASFAVIAAILGPTLVPHPAPGPVEQLALQRSDLPATTRKSDRPQPHAVDPSHLRPFGIPGLQAADYTYTWPAGGKLNTPIGVIDKEWLIAGEVFLAPDEQAAKRLYRLGVAAQIGHFSYDDFPGEPSPLGLPVYGDEQIGRVATDPATGLGVMVFVRKGKVVWQLRVATIPLQFQATQAQLVEVLNTYARKQKGRIGDG
jgi:hypothetical protein